MAAEFPLRKEQLIFLINNYDMMLAVLMVGMQEKPALYPPRVVAISQVSHAKETQGKSAMAEPITTAAKSTKQASKQNNQISSQKLLVFRVKLVGNVASG